VQQFASYARLVRCAQESAGKKLGTSGAKMGNVRLKWAFSEAALLFVRHCAAGKQLLARLERHGKGKALSIVAHKLGRAAYYMLAREKAFDLERFAATVSWRGRGNERGRRLTRAPWIELDETAVFPCTASAARHRS
jgi:hypothetical protein